MNDRKRAESRHRWIVWDTNASFAGFAEGRSRRAAGATAGKLGSSRNFETAVQSNADDAKIRGWKSPSRRAAMGTSGVPSRSAPLAEARGATSRVFARVFASASVCP